MSDWVIINNDLSNSINDSIIEENDLSYSCVYSLDSSLYTVYSKTPTLDSFPCTPSLLYQLLREIRNFDKFSLISIGSVSLFRS